MPERKINVAVVTPRHVQCGIADYAKALVEELEKDPRILVRVIENKNINSPFYFFSLGKTAAEKGDVIHVHFEYGLFGRFFIQGVLAPFFYWGTGQKPVITTMHEVITYSSFKMKVIGAARSMVDSVIISHSEKIIVTTEEAEKILVRRFPRKKPVLIPLGFYQRIKTVSSFAAKERLGLAGKKILTLFGFVTRHKNYESVLRALHELGDEYHVVIIGEPKDAKYLEKLRQLATDEKLSKQVVFAGYVSLDGLNRYFSATDLFLFPYRNVTGSAALSFALNAQKPILCTNLPEFKKFEHQGILKTYASEKELADKIRSTIKWEPKGLREYRTKNGIEFFAKEHAELYLRCTSGTKSQELDTKRGRNKK
ncbi:MAG: glycosyltransferase [Candidatus Micrarchaeota archaeon]